MVFLFSYLYDKLPVVEFSFGMVCVVYSDPLCRNGSTGKWDDVDKSAADGDILMYSNGDNGSDATDRRAVLAIAMETFSTMNRTIIDL